MLLLSVWLEAQVVVDTGCGGLGLRDVGGSWEGGLEMGLLRTNRRLVKKYSQQTIKRQRQRQEDAMLEM